MSSEAAAFGLGKKSHNLPAQDYYHNAVKRALIKVGWKITAEQYFIKLPERRFWLALEAEFESEGRHVFVEVKSFRNIYRLRKVWLLLLENT